MDPSTTYAPNGMVCSPDHLASGAGVAALLAGGSAADAAVAASAVLAVTTQHMCGMGGDLFALVHDPGAPGGPAVLNASGRAGSGADADRLRAEGHTAMPFRGDIRSVPVPGCVDGWLALHGRFGRLDLATVLAPSIAYARDGFPASPMLARACSTIAGLQDADDFVGAGPPKPGARLRRPGVARALEAVAREGRDGFYLGEFGAGLLALGRGEFTHQDLAEPNADWVAPLGARVFDSEVWTTPPNSQGYLTLLGALIAEALPLPEDPADPAWAHLLIESARAAGHDRPAVLADGADVADLLAPGSVAQRRSGVSPGTRAPHHLPAAGGGTIFLCAVDGDGMGVSLIQSNAAGFGAHLVVPGVRIFLQNRGIGFSIAAGHPAEYGPRRRPPHTLAPVLVTRPDGWLRAVVGTMGGDTQPQILLQLLARLLRHGQPSGETVAAGRWALRNPQGSPFDTWSQRGTQTVTVEQHSPPSWADGLRARGHDVQVVPSGHDFGHAQVIEIGADGMRCGASDPRAEVGAAVGY